MPLPERDDLVSNQNDAAQRREGDERSEHGDRGELDRLRICTFEDPAEGPFGIGPSELSKLTYLGYNEGTTIP